MTVQGRGGLHARHQGDGHNAERNQDFDQRETTLRDQRMFARHRQSGSGCTAKGRTPSVAKRTRCSGALLEVNTTD